MLISIWLIIRWEWLRGMIKEFPYSDVQAYGMVGVLIGYVICRALSKNRRLTRFGYTSYLSTEFYCILLAQFVTVWGVPAKYAVYFLAGNQVVYMLSRGFSKLKGAPQTINL